MNSWYIYVHILVVGVVLIIHERSRHGILREHVSIACGRYVEIVEGYVEINNVKVWKPIYWEVFSKDALFVALFSNDYKIDCTYKIKYHS